MKRKYERRFSITDLFLILLFALIAVSAFLRWSGLQRVSPKGTEPQELVLYSEVTLPAVATCFSEGELLYTNDGNLLGRLLSVERFPVSESLISDGQRYEGTWDLSYRCRLRLTVEGEIAFSDGLMLLNGLTPVSVGESLIVQGGDAKLTFWLYEIVD